MAGICIECGGKQRKHRGDFTFREIGIDGVVLKNVEIIRCQQCGCEIPVIPRINELMRTVALAVVSKPSELTGGEVRFLREYLGKSGEEFSRLVHIHKSTLSKWEHNEDPIGAQSDRLIRLLTLALDDRLRAKAKQVAEAFPSISESKRPMSVAVDPETGEYSYHVA